MPGRSGGYPGRALWLSVILMLSVNTRAEWHLKIPVSPEPPWVIQTDTGIEGVDLHIIRKMAEDLDFSYTLIPCPWARCLKIMELGQADLMLGVFKRPEREKYLAFIEPGYLLDDPKVFYLPSDSPVQINTYKDLRNLQVGVMRGAAYFTRFDQDNNLSKIEVTDEVQLLQMLSKRRLDTIIGSPTVIRYQINRLGLKGEFRQSAFRQSSEGYSYMAIARSSGFVGQLDRVSEWIREQKERGYFRTVVDRIIDSGSDQD